MAQKNEHELGKLCANGTSYRDATHIAVIKCEAVEELLPSQGVYIHCSYSGEYQAWRSNDYGRPKVGIVDPFLAKKVNVGDYFLVVLTPGTVTGLRHTWSHPTIGDEVVEKEEEDSGWGDECRGC